MKRSLPGVLSLPTLLMATAAHADAVVPIDLLGHEIFDTVVDGGIGEFPRMGVRGIVRDASQSEVAFTTGGIIREVLWRHPVHDTRTSKTGDTVTLTAQLDWRVVADPEFDGELAMMLSDGARVMGASFGFDGGQGFQATILHDECEFGDVYTNTTTPSDFARLATVMPIELRIEVGPDGSRVSARNGDPSAPEVSFDLPFTLDVTRDLDFLVGGREADIKQFVLQRARLDRAVSPGPIRNKWDLDIRTDLCGPLINTPPIARCRDRSFVAPSTSCRVCDPDLLAQIDDGSFDPDGHSWSIERFTPECLELGSQTLNMRIDDELGAFDICASTVSVVDQSEPTITFQGEDASICGRGPEYVEFIPPIVADACTSNVELRGQIVAVNDSTLPQPVELDAGFGALVMAGRVAIAWIANDAAGNEAIRVEVIEIEARSDLATCCPAVDWWVEGSNWDDWLDFSRYSSDFGIDGRGGHDHIYLGWGDDCALGSSSYDEIDVGDGDNMAWGGSGSDQIYCSYWSGALEAHGDLGDDWINASWCESGELYGGPGDDYIYGSYYGDDWIVPGSGVDTVYAGDGDDVVILYGECEIESGKYFSGGWGYDVLIAPVPFDELEARGIDVYGFERFILDDSSAQLADCD